MVSLQFLLFQPQTAFDYCPDTCDDPEFHGIAVGCPEVCREHRLEPRKCVAFEGSNVGRRFYMCQVQDVSTDSIFPRFICANYIL
jgi:hypothetical protein